MLTVKQIETFYWVAKLGTVQRAADKLHITQSAATKRLQDVEAKSAARLFEGSGKKARLSAKGHEMFTLCEGLLDSIERLEAYQDADRQMARVLHIGLTELVALTWFPAFLQQMRDLFPNLILQPHVDMSGPLQERVIDGRLDFAILPDAALPASIERVMLGSARFAWFCRPGAFDSKRTVSLHELSTVPVIEQIPASIITVLSSRSFESAGVEPERICGGNNAVAVGGLVAAGVGVSLLPVDLFRQQIQNRLMQIVMTNPPAPMVRYDAIFQKQSHSALGHMVADVARRCCDFSSGVQQPTAG
ncbi:LysR family transcriptional regulator [Paraburkholderia fungorum]|jgi:DNA-binding transcriptional LysR family regulator|uniref:LysR family transcriptional regulator n=1 Tax=Paraburkholderia fungorum TaxID=134537 RepID=A0AAP5Q4M8_9BURK|nr:LysR family transcriptional regulator [Paraburkholderia fungorum]MBU7438052.1 LysR family transcriptional regulator [Paraburkholderia fungorum]MDT8836980.1 LysR family transcriptional regulator [Paraburkholderia fungorum]PRZ54241.1 LysR family transcriptional regulator [Paraburkholderia fungorum]USU19246.1 LysR family transcriptional regulator [Paraburkholderia fungorum]USU28758.1 LysR family transcriptional regulator [Paraburkholderia fungorum]